MRRIALTVNGVRREAEVEPRLLLVYFLRESLGLTGTSVGCDTTSCGACTVLAVQADGSEITTIEGLATDGQLHPLQESFRKNHGLQCGYCTPGMIMAGRGLIESGAGMGDEEVRLGLEGNLCRCTGYHNIVRAVLAAAGRDADADQAAALAPPDTDAPVDPADVRYPGFSAGSGT